MDESIDLTKERRTIGIQLTDSECEEFDRADIYFFTDENNLQQIGFINAIHLRDNMLSSSFAGVLVCMEINHEYYPVLQKTMGNEYRIYNLGLVTDDVVNFNKAIIDSLEMNLNSSDNTVSIKHIGISRPVNVMEKISELEYWTYNYQYEDQPGSRLLDTQVITGDYGKMVDGKAQLSIRSAEEINPYVIFVITNKDRSVYTKAAYYKDIISK